jgi:hypothetical protein
MRLYSYPTLFLFFLAKQLTAQSYTEKNTILICISSQDLEAAEKAKSEFAHLNKC